MSIGSTTSRCLVVLAATGALVITGCTEETPEVTTIDPEPVETPADVGSPWFSEEAVARGIDFTHVSGHESRHLMPEIMSGGGALLDVDNDGDLDAYLVQGGNVVSPGDDAGRNRLYLNDGEGRFTDATDGSGADDAGYGMGVATGDYDGDGFIDLYITNVGPNTLLRNRGDGTFEDVTATAGVGDEGFGSSAAFVDIDHDGDLDLFTLNYLRWSIGSELDCIGELGTPDYCDPQNYQAPAPDVLYRNDGNGSFTDITAEAGLLEAFGTGLGVSAADFNADGRVDLFVANDGMPDQLWISQPDGRFLDEAMFLGCAVDQEGMPKAGMGVTVADIDDDGDPDLLVCNLRRETDSMFLNEGGQFRDITTATGLAGVSRPFTRFGMAWLDFDNDGRLDLFQATGRVMRQATTFTDDPFAEPNLLLRGLDGPRYEEVKPRGGTATPLYATGRAAAFGDVNGDGGVDILVVNRDGPAHLLMNVVPDRGGWLQLRVMDDGRDAIGARVEVTIGQRRMTRTVRTAYSYQAANDAAIHIGLGDATSVDAVTVTWIDGTVESFGTAEGGATVVLERGTGEAAAEGS